VQCKDVSSILGSFHSYILVSLTYQEDGSIGSVYISACVCVFVFMSQHLTCWSWPTLVCKQLTIETYKWKTPNVDVQFIDQKCCVISRQRGWWEKYGEDYTIIYESQLKWKSNHVFIITPLIHSFTVTYVILTQSLKWGFRQLIIIIVRAKHCIMGIRQHTKICFNDKNTCIYHVNT